MLVVRISRAVTGAGRFGCPVAMSTRRGSCEVNSAGSVRAICSSIPMSHCTRSGNSHNSNATTGCRRRKPKRGRPASTRTIPVMSASVALRGG
jgi:hypothetical protein